MMIITVILTCFNRKEKTVECVRSLQNGNINYKLKFIVVDDKSTDGTVEALNKINADIKIIKGTGNLFWSGGMRKGIEWFLKNDNQSEYVLLVNDDVIFFENILDKMVKKSILNNNAVIVGATCDKKGNYSYGGMVLENPKKKGFYRHVKLDEKNVSCDLFNCNCVLIQSDIVREVGNFDPIYVHALADLDYGLKLSRSGFLMLLSDNYVGVCEKNTIEGTWLDKKLSRIERLKKKETVKGAPFKIWFYYVYKNFGLIPALQYSLSPYVKILLKK